MFDMLLLVISFLVIEWEVDIGVFMGKIDVMGGREFGRRF